MNKIITSVFAVLIISLITGSVTISSKVIHQNNFSDTSWKYLGQMRPGLTPLRFPPDSLLANNNWMWHGTPIFSPDLKEIFWCKYNHSTEQGELVFVKYINGNWTPMQNAPFGNQNCWENCPFFSYSGDTLFFVSKRSGGFIFRTCRSSSGWTSPIAINIPIPAGYSPGLDFTLALNGTIYFVLFIPGQPSTADIYKSIIVNGQYQLPENLGNIVNSDSNETSPYIDPYERFILFASKKQGGYGLHDIYISKRNPDNTWNTPVNLGYTINSSTEDVFPYITPDSMYFFYETGRNQPIGYNPFWINAQYIYNLAAIGIQKSSTEIPSAYFLFQNYPNPFNPTTKIIASLAPSEGWKQDVKLVIYDILGKEIAVFTPPLWGGREGLYEVEWDASDYPSGIYFYTLASDDFKSTRKMVLIK